MLGKTISHYEVLERLGGGGMGVVYKARDTVLGRFVALKVVSPDLLEDAAALNGFIREAKAASALNHPNILTVHDLVEADGARFLVMELVEGRTLRHCIGEKGMGTKPLLSTALQVAEALAAAHHAGIIHRDLKPENIMVRGDGQVKVVDFGLAKLLHRTVADRAPSATTTADATIPIEEAIRRHNASDEKSHVAGTIPYMSPEQLSGKPADPRSDIFSLGVVLYEMAAGRPPFQGLTTRELVDQILEREPKPLSELATAVPEKIHEVVSKCLEKDPAERYQHADDIVVDLRKVKRVTESGPRITLPRKTEAYGAPAAPVPARGHRRSWVIYSVVVTLLLAAAVGLIIRRLGNRPQLDMVLKWGDEIGNAAISPDGTTIAFDSTVTGQHEVYVMLAKGGSPRQVTQGPGDKFDPRFSRDGTQLLYTVQGEGSAIWTISALGMNAQKLLSNASSADWSPDGQRVAYARRVTGEPAQLVICDASGFNENSIYTSRFEKISEIRWSPDNQWVFFNDQQSPMLISPNGGQARKLENLPNNADDVAWFPYGQFLYYSNRVNGITNIWRLKPPDGEPAKITQGPGDDFDPMPMFGAHTLVYAHGRKERDVWLDSSREKQPRKITRGGWVSSPALSPNGKRIAYIGEEADGLEYVWTTDGTGENATKVTRQGAYSSLVWSADGGRLAYSAAVEKPSEFSHVFVLDSTDKTTKQVTQGDFDAYADDFRPDGKALLYEKVVQMKSTLMSVDLTTGKEIGVGNDLEGGKFSSNARWVLALGSTDKPEQKGLWILPANGGAGTRVLTQAVSYAKWAESDRAIVYSLAGKTKGEIRLWKLPVQNGEAAGSPSIFFSFPAPSYADDDWDVTSDLSWIAHPHTDNRGDLYKITRRRGE